MDRKHGYILHGQWYNPDLYEKTFYNMPCTLFYNLGNKNVQYYTT